MLSEPESTRTGGAAGTGRRDARLILAAYVLLSVAGLFGLMIGSVPFGVDYPNHAARLFIECNQNDPYLSRMYSVEYGIIPNLAIDLLYRPLCGAVDPMTFLRGTLVLTIAGILFVVWMLRSVLDGGRPSAFVLLAPAMTFNLVTSMGYLNYLIGTFLFLLFAWVMLRFDVLRRRQTLAIVVPNIFGSLIFLCHIFAVALAGIFLFGLRFATGSGQPLLKRISKAAIMSAASFALPLGMTLTAESSGFGPIYTFGAKIRALWAPVFFSNVMAAATLSFAWTALAYWAFRERSVSVSRTLRWPLFFLIGYALLLPSALLNAVDLDSRSLVSILLLGIAGLSVRPTSLGRVPELAAAGVAVVTICVQLSVLVPQAITFGAQVNEFRQAIRIIPAGAPVLSVAAMESSPPAPLRFYSHLTSYTTRDRRAYNPLEFDGKGMQPMSVRPEFACIDVPGGPLIPDRIVGKLLGPGADDFVRRPEYLRFGYARQWDQNFAYVIYYHFDSPRLTLPTTRLVREGSFFTIYQTSGTPSLEGPCKLLPRST